MPVILEKVPGFFVPGKFDQELDVLTKDSANRALGQMQERQKLTAPASAPVPTTSPATDEKNPVESRSVPGAEQATVGTCDAPGIAKNWLGELDVAMATGDAKGVMRLFTEDVAVEANVIGKDGAQSKVRVSSGDFFKSTLAAMKGLKDYVQQRTQISGSEVAGGNCSKIIAVSNVIERGSQSGSTFSFESTESYTLEKRGDRWLATLASTRQR